MEFIAEQDLSSLDNILADLAGTYPNTISELMEVPIYENPIIPDIPKKLPLNEYLDPNEYRGPLDESNKVIDRLYAGCFPGDANDKINETNLVKLLNDGFTAFVCMQKELRLDSREEEWRVWNTTVRPYIVDIRNMLKYRHLHPDLNESVPSEIIFEHFPIQDLKTTSDEDTLKAAKRVVELLEQGEKVYLHCWGGHGRTGVIVCLVLHLIYKISAQEAIRFCELVHSQRVAQIDVRSPQTDMQREQVRRIITLLTQEQVEDGQGEEQEEV